MSDTAPPHGPRTSAALSATLNQCGFLKREVHGPLLESASELEAENTKLRETLDELTDGRRLILPKTEPHARAMYLVSFNALKDFGKTPT